MVSEGADDGSARGPHGARHRSSERHRPRDRRAARGRGGAGRRCRPRGRPRPGRSVLPLRWDLSTRPRSTSSSTEAEALAGPLDVLVNNAGVFEPALAVDLTLESYRRVLAVNLHAPVLPGEPRRARDDRARLRPHRQHHVGARPLRRGVGALLRRRQGRPRAGDARRSLSSSHGSASLSTPSRRFRRDPDVHRRRQGQLESEWFQEVYLQHGKLPIRATPAGRDRRACCVARERAEHVRHRAGADGRRRAHGDVLTRRRRRRVCVGPTETGR